MRRPIFSFRPKMANAEHRRAWEILCSVPEGQKNNFIVQAILKAEAADRLAQVVRSAVREALENREIKPSKRDVSGEIPEQMLDFLAQMEDGM